MLKIHLFFQKLVSFLSLFAVKSEKLLLAEVHKVKTDVLDALERDGVGRQITRHVWAGHNLSFRVANVDLDVAWQAVRLHRAGVTSGVEVG